MMIGDCDVQDDCVSSRNYPSAYGNSESCSVIMLRDATVTPGSVFSLETCCDHLTIQGNDVGSSSAVPEFLNAGEIFSWASDGSGTREGWQLCFSANPGSSSTSTSTNALGNVNFERIFGTF